MWMVGQRGGWRLDWRRGPTPQHEQMQACQSTPKMAFGCSTGIQHDGGSQPSAPGRAFAAPFAANIHWFNSHRDAPMWRAVSAAAMRQPSSPSGVSGKSSMAITLPAAVHAAPSKNAGRRRPVSLGCWLSGFALCVCEGGDGPMHESTPTCAAAPQQDASICSPPTAARGAGPLTGAAWAPPVAGCA